MDFKAYIKGKRKGKEAHNIERAAGHDSFLRDAIDGFDAVEGDHLSSIEYLEKQVETLSKPRNRRFQPLFWYSSAATILLLLALWIFFPSNDRTDYLANESKPALPSEIEFVREDSVDKPAATPEVEPMTIETPKKIIAQSTSPKNTVKKEIALAEPIVVLNETEDPQVPATTQARLAQPETLVMARPTKAESNEMIISAPVAQSAPTVAANVLGNKIQGRVLDENGEALVGVSVSFKDTYKSTITDNNGHFVLEIPKNNNRPLVLSYVGYETKELSVNESNIEVKMQADQLALNEVVVVGYGSQKRTSRVGSVARVDNQEKKSTTEPIFGEKEFLRFYEVLRTKRICNTKKESLTARFYIDEKGKATELQIEKASCEAMAEEFRRIVAQSPAWTKRDRIVIFRF
jgi:hypothetical protein